MSARYTHEAARSEITGWVVELSMVEHVERVDSDLDLALTGDCDALFQADIGIVPSGADDEVPHCITNRALGLWAINARLPARVCLWAIDPKMLSIVPWVKVAHVAALVIRHIHAKCSEERVVSRVANADWRACRKSRRTGNHPIMREAREPAREFVKG